MIITKAGRRVKGNYPLYGEVVYLEAVILPGYQGRGIIVYGRPPREE